MWSVFFFKQRTAYEMRISDWSSDVCASDLTVRSGRKCTGVTIVAAMMRVQCRTTTGVQAAAGHRRADEQGKQPEDSASARKHGLTAGQSPDAVQQQIRSEEHTSELQSLMRISYAVFCLKKKRMMR